MNPTNLKLHAIRTFITTVKAGSIRAAARQLNLTQPAISKALKGLEDDLGVSLFTRGTKGIELTDFGRAFHERSITIINEVQYAVNEIKQMRGELDGHVQISVSPAVAIYIAPKAIRNFRQEFPNTTIRIFEALQARAIQQLRSSEIDLALVPIYTPLSNKEFIVTPLVDIQLHIICRKGHPLEKATHLHQLQDAEWTHVSSGAEHTPLISQLFSKHQLPAPKIGIDCFSLLSSLATAQNTDCLCLLPEIMLQQPYFSTQNLSIINIAESGNINRIYLVQRRDKPLTPVAQKLANHILRFGDLNDEN